MSDKKNKKALKPKVSGKKTKTRLKIIFLNGPHKGKEFSVKAGVVLSRNVVEKNDIAIEDVGASNPHAEIVKKKGRFYLNDMDSKNGTYLDNEINDCFVLKPERKFKIGKTWLKVIQPVEPVPKKPQRVAKKKLFWSDVVIKELKALSLTDQANKQVRVINPALVLKFKAGAQKGEKWLIGYGPRELGSATWDMPILDMEAPGICFSLEPLATNKVLFKTSYPEQVLLNNQHITKKEIKDGDFICVANTYIELSYYKN